jgi:maltose O-acetyltransferase
MFCGDEGPGKDGSRVREVRQVRSVARNVIAVSRARWVLRHATALGHRTRLTGSARVVNHGRMLIGERVRLDGSQAPLEIIATSGGTLEIGERTFVNFGASIVAHEHITIGALCLIGPYCSVMDNSYHRLEPDRRYEAPPSEPVVIGDNVWLGLRTIVLPGVTIGDDAVIGAGSVVSHDVPPGVLAGGVPARVIRSL